MPGDYCPDADRYLPYPDHGLEIRRLLALVHYLGCPDLAAIKKSPNLEIFRKRGLEVLFLTDAVDEFVMSAAYV